MMLSISSFGSFRFSNLLGADLLPIGTGCTKVYYGRGIDSGSRRTSENGLQCYWVALDGANTTLFRT